MFRKTGYSDIKINDSNNLSKLICSLPQAESTQIENGLKSSGKLTPKRRAVSQLQNSKGISKISNLSPVLSKKIDPQVFTDVQSRGLASRIVKYHELNKQNERQTIRSNYTKPGDFPIVNLNVKKELPYVIKRNLSSKNPPVRIAPPEKATTNINYRSSMLRSSGILIKNDNEPLVSTTIIGDVNTRTRSVLDELTEISRKRINNEELKIDSIKKTCIEGNGTTEQTDGGCIGLGSKGLGGNKKRQRDSSFSTSPSSISPTKLDNLHLNKKNCLLNKKPSMLKNNDILSSLSSSMIFPNNKLHRNNKNTISHSNIYNTNNVFIQSIERQYHNRLPSFDAQPNGANKINLIHTSTSIAGQTPYDILMTQGATASNLIVTRSEPHKPVSQKLLLFNRPEIPQQHVIKVNQISEDSTVNFVKPKQIIDNNLIIEPNKINENSLVKRKSNLTGIERSKLAMMLEYLKSDDEDDNDVPRDETDNKFVEPPILPKSNLPNISSTAASITSNLSLPSTSSWLTTTTPQTFTSILPKISSDENDKSTTLTTTITTASVTPVVTSKIETSSTMNETQNTPTTSILESIITTNVSTVESKTDFNSTAAVPSSRIGGFSFPINSSTSSSVPITTKLEFTTSEINSSLNTIPSNSFNKNIEVNEALPSFSPISSVAEKQPQQSQTFSFFNKPNTTVATTQLPAPPSNVASSINFSSSVPILPMPLINFSSPQINSTCISKAPLEPISFTSPVQLSPRTGLNVTFGGAPLPTTIATSTIVPVTTAVSKFSFSTNDANSGVNSNFSGAATTTTNMFSPFSSVGYNTTSDFNGINKPKVQTTISSLQPVCTVTTEPSLSFLQNTAVSAPSVSVVKPFSFSGSNVSPIPTATESSMFNSGNQQNKNMFGQFATAPTTTAPAFTFRSNSVTSNQQNNGFGNSQIATTQQNNVFGNSQITTTQQNNIFGNPQASPIQPNNVFGNTQAPTVSSNNSEITLFNFKTATTNNTTNQTPTETSPNVFQLRSAGTANFGNQPTNNVFGGNRMQQKNDIFGGGMANNTVKAGGGVFNFSTPSKPQTNQPPASTFSFGDVNKNQTPASNTNVFGSSNNESNQAAASNTNVFSSSNNEPPKQFSFGGNNTINKIQTPPTFGSNNDTSKNFTFGQNTTAINSNNLNKSSGFGPNMFASSNTDTAKLEPLKPAFAFGSPSSTQSQAPAQSMFSFSNNTNLGHANNNPNVSAPAPVFGQAAAAGTPQNPFSIGPALNAPRRPVRTAMRRLNK